MKKCLTVFIYAFLSVFIVAGSLVLIYSGVLFIRNLTFVSKAEKATGSVVDTFSSKRALFPIVSFKTADGQQIKFRSKNGRGGKESFLYQTVQVLYDPRQPQNAEINSFMTLWMPPIGGAILGLVFAGVGIGPILLSRARIKADAAFQEELKKGYTFWQINPDWKNGRVGSTVKTDMKRYWLFATFLSAISLPLVLFLPRELAKGNYPALLGLVFPVFNIGLMVVAVRKTLQWRKFGDITLILDPFPGSIGGDIGGTIDLSIPYDRSIHFKMRLSCLQVFRGRSRYEKLVWEGLGAVEAEASSNGTRLGFKVSAPKDLPESEQPSRNYHQWVISITADLPGISLDRTFVVPVINTERPMLSRLDIKTTTDFIPALLPANHVVQIHNMPNKMVLCYSVLRNLKNGLIVLFTGAIFTSGLFYVYSSNLLTPIPKSTTAASNLVDTGWQLLTAEAYIMFYIFLPIGLLMIGYSLYLLGNSLRIEIGAGYIRTVRRLFGIKVFTRSLLISELSSIQLKRYGQRGEGVNAKIYYALDAIAHDGHNITVGDGIVGLDTAEQLSEVIREACGLRKEMKVGL